MQPLYQNDSHALSNPPQGGHLGLWFERFFDKFENDWSIQPESKKAWIQTVCRKQGNLEQLSQQARRCQQLAKALGGGYREFKTQGTFVTGTGISHPVENGITWHRTLALPYLPGSGVKGLLRAWVEQWMEFADEDQRQLTSQRWFGHATGDEGSAGELVFHDLLPSQPLELACEVMTPHMGKWYEQGGDIRSPADLAGSAPADWHSPVPIPFLTVKNGHFATLITPRVAAATTEVDRALGELAKALEWLGAGAKTATGFGRMVDVLDLQRREAEAEQQRMAANAEDWAGAQITYNRGGKTLVAKKGGREASAPPDKSAVLLTALKPDVRKKIETGQFVKLNVRVADSNLLEWLP